MTTTIRAKLTKRPARPTGATVVIKRLLVVIALVSLGIASAYFWKENKRQGIDPSLFETMLSHDCPNCEARFSISVADEGAMIRKRGAIHCSICDEVIDLAEAQSRSSLIGRAATATEGQNSYPQIIVEPVVRVPAIKPK